MLHHDTSHIDIYALAYIHGLLFFTRGILCFECMTDPTGLYLLCLSGIFNLYKYAICPNWSKLIFASYFSLNAFNKSLLSLNDCDSNHSNLSLVQ